jgi:hypothetical protein
MKRYPRRRFPLAGILAIPASVFLGCAGHGQPSACNGPTTTFQPGERVRGYDPASVLAPYWGTFHGTLTWTAGGQTSLVVTSAQMPNEPLHGACNGNQLNEVYTYGTVTLVTGDGGLNDAFVTIVGARFPDTPECCVSLPTPPVVPSVSPPTSWSALSPHLMTNVARYTDPALLLTIDWPPGRGAPSSASIWFEGSPAPNTTDGFWVASITFP